jgi:hypothetical protein
VELPGAEGSFGARLIAKIAEAPTHTIETITRDAADVLLVSVHFPGQLVHLQRLFRNLSVHPDPTQRQAPYIVAGGYGCNNPEPMLAVADSVVVGDGEPYAEALRDGADPRSGDCDNIPGVVLHAAATEVAPWGSPTSRPDIHASDGAGLTGENVICRFDGSDHLPTVELARGCRTRCTFCAVGNTKRYRELPLEDAQRAHADAKRLFAADLGSLSYFQECEWLTTTAGGLSVAAALRQPACIGRLAMPTVGVEGWSERLRRLVGKPIADADLQRLVALRIEAGKHIMLWYMMHSLPTSNATDRLQFLKLINGLPSGATLRLSFTPYQKQPHTPMAYAAARFDHAEAALPKRIRKECVTAAKKVVFTGKGEPKHYTDTLAACGTQAIAGLFVNYGGSVLNWSMEKLRQAARAYGNDIDAICAEWPETKDLPWGYVDFGVDPRQRYEKHIKPALTA